MPNPGGVNQLGASHVPYGAVKRMKQLAGEAPMSGAPLATSALEAPRRARKNPQGQKSQAPVPAPVAVHPDYQQLPQLPSQELYQGIASIPGASPLVKTIFSGQ